MRSPGLKCRRGELTEDAHSPLKRENFKLSQEELRIPLTFQNIEVIILIAIEKEKEHLQRNGAHQISLSHCILIIHVLLCLIAPHIHTHSRSCAGGLVVGNWWGLEEVGWEV